MTSLLGAKKRAEEFATAVEDDTARAGLPLEVARLVGVVDALRERPAPEPRAEFTATLREQLLAEAEAVLAQDAILTLPPRRHGARERRLALVASSLVLVGGSAGMAAAAQDALPGDALYPIKRGLEAAEADLSGSNAARGQDLLEQADTRLTEVRALLDGSGDTTQVSATIDDFNSQAAQGTDLLLDSFEDSRDRAAVEDVRGFTADSLAALQSLAKSAPAEHQDELAQAALAVLEIDERALGACASCAEQLPPLQLPTMFVSATEASRALAATQRLVVNNDHPVITGAVAPPASKSDSEDQPTDGGTSGGGTGGDAGDLPGLPGGDVDVEGPSGGDAGGLGGIKDKVDDGTGGTTVGGKDVTPEELDSLGDTLLP